MSGGGQHSTPKGCGWDEKGMGSKRRPGGAPRMGFLQDGRTLRSNMNDVLGRVVKRKMGSIGEREKGAGALEDFKDQAERGD